MKMLTIGPNPNWAPPKDADPVAAKEMKAVYEAIKKRKPTATLTKPYVAAMQDIRNSKGMYSIVAVEEAKAPEPGPRLLEDYTNDELKVMMLNVGVKTEKKMKRADIIALIRQKLDSVEIDEDEGPSAA